MAMIGCNADTFIVKSHNLKFLRICMIVVAQFIIKSTLITPEAFVYFTPS